MAASLIFAGGLLWAYFLRYGRDANNDSIAELNLGDWERPILNDAELRIRRPVTPNRWQKLVSLQAPREVQTGRNYRVDVFVMGVLVLLNGEAVWRRFTTSDARLETDFALAFFALLYVIVPLCVTILSIRREREARELLRSGEVTIGFWGEGTYQFWTGTGERFEHAGAIVADGDDALTDAGLVPVFYSRDDPSKSVALCCIRSRVRRPSTEAARQSGDWRSRRTES